MKKLSAKQKAGKVFELPLKDIEKSQDYCPECGLIKFTYRVGDLELLGDYDHPQYCGKCHIVFCVTFELANTIKED